METEGGEVFRDVRDLTRRRQLQPEVPVRGIPEGFIESATKASHVRPKEDSRRGDEILHEQAG
jgi:hypothetical protein